MRAKGRIDMRLPGLPTRATAEAVPAHEALFIARLMRLMTVRAYREQGTLTDNDAHDLLAGCLTPGDDSTRVDDSALLAAPASTDWRAALDADGGEGQ